MSTEDNIARIVQLAQDGWEKPRPNVLRPNLEGKTVKTNLMAFDFSKAYDKVWKHGLLHKLINMNIPTKIIRWVRGFITERYAKVTVEGRHSKWTRFNEGLPQGSVIAPLLFILFLSDLNTDLKNHRADPNFFADDTSVATQGNTIQEAEERAQNAADKFSQWARKWKMVIAAEKTQVLVLSQNAKDVKEVKLKIRGKEIKQSPHIKILGVTLDRLLHFGKHAMEVGRKTMRRCRQLAQVASRSWGTDVKTRKTMVSSYVDGTARYAIGAWGPATAKSHLQKIETSRRMAARIQTGCIKSTPNDVLYAEARMLPIEHHIEAAAAKLYEKAKRQDISYPLGELVNKPQTRVRNMKSVMGWRKVGERVTERIGLSTFSRETEPENQKIKQGCIVFNTELHIDKETSEAERKFKADKFVDEVVPKGTMIWTDGSAEEGVKNGGAGAYIVGDTVVRKAAAAGPFCSSTQAIKLGLTNAPRGEVEVNVLLDSLAAIQRLKRGPENQKTKAGVDIWKAAERIGKVNIFWVPSHCGVEGNEEADKLAKTGSKMRQGNIGINLEVAKNVIARETTRSFLEHRRKVDSRGDEDPHWKLYADRWPPETAGRNQVVKRQIRSGHCPLLRFTAHRMGLRPTEQCTECQSLSCVAAVCRWCGMGAEMTLHLLFQCPFWEKKSNNIDVKLEELTKELAGPNGPRA